MCNNAVINDPEVLKYIPDQYITQEMCNNAVINDLCVLEYVPDKYKTQEMCNGAVNEKHWVKYVIVKALEYVPDYFVTKEMMKMGCKDYCKNFYENYYKQKKLKKDIHEKLAPIDGGIGVLLLMKNGKLKKCGKINEPKVFATRNSKKTEYSRAV